MINKLQSVQTLFVNNFKQFYCDSEKVEKFFFYVSYRNFYVILWLFFSIKKITHPWWLNPDHRIPVHKRYR